MSDPDTRPTPARGMQAIRVTLAKIADNGLSAVVRQLLAEIVLVQDQQSTEIAQLREAVSRHEKSVFAHDEELVELRIQDQAFHAMAKERTERLDRHETEIANNTKDGFAFAKATQRMRRIIKVQEQQAEANKQQAETNRLLREAVRSPKLMRHITFGVAVGTIIATLLSKAC